MAAELRKAAEAGGMKQITVNNVWTWVCPAVASRNDPSIGKETGRMAAQDAGFACD
jgi:hypothetical protein